MEWVVNATPWPLYPRGRPGAHGVGGWVVPMVGLDGCGKSRLHRDSIPERSNPKRVALLTELSRRTFNSKYYVKFVISFTLQMMS
jgi:hypothetical protein